jgi:hypothetical protein
VSSSDATARFGECDHEGGDSMNLYEETKRLWTPERAQVADRWGREVEQGLPMLVKASKEFNEPKPLRFYITVGNVSKAGKGGKPTLSLRFQGQEVATVTVSHSPALIVTKNHERTNLKHFGVATIAGKCRWRSAPAARFRAAFRKANNLGVPKSEEHQLEARILKALEERRGEPKFAGTLRNVRHCGLTKHEYPLQVPVHISGNTGTPVATRGNIDILARRGLGRGTYLSVWELKRPGEIQHALAQAYIYAVSIILMLRGHQGDTWYRNFQFKSPVPSSSLHVEAVTVLTEDQAPKLKAAHARLIKESPLLLPAEQARISLHAAYYDPKSLAIEWIELH